VEIYDYIVVGAGSAGCVIARGLTDDKNNNVLLLEAGPPTDRFWVHTPAGMAKLFHHDELNWNYFTEPMPALRGRRMYWPRGKGLGGSGAINGMIYIRGHRSDFDGWRRLGNPGWGYDDVLPYFKSIEHNERGEDAYRSRGGPLWISDPALKMQSSVDFIASAQAVGIPRTEDLNGEVHDGVGFMQYTIRKGKRQSAYVAFLKPVLHRKNLNIQTDARVQRILFDGKRAVGVEVAVNGQKRTLHAAREVILSAGSLNSPQILMLSGVGPGQELQRHGIEVVHEAPGVGENLQDHFYVHTAYRATPSSSYNSSIRGLRKYFEGARYLLTSGGYLALGTSQVAAFVRSREDVDYADLQISFRPMTFKYHPDGRVEVDRDPGMGVSVFILRPRTTGAVTLRSADPGDTPMFTPNFLTDDEDVRAMLSGMRKIREIMATRPVASRVVGEDLPGVGVQTDQQLLEYMAETGNTASHQTSTCRMGPDAMSVVDEHLRVRGVERLRVIDASVMPYVTSGNTNAPTLMIAAKGVDLVRQDALPRRPIG
jgi:choline dehydrogenase